MDTISLFELQTAIKNGINSLFSGKYNIVAEINEIKTNSSGHCYMELVEQDEKSNTPKAKCNAQIWAYTYRMLKPYFETETGRQLESGMKILVSAKVNYHEIYGLSLNIVDIDPTFTIGEIELKRRKTIQKLIEDGVFDINRELEFPILPLNIAVISSETAAGYQDFINQLFDNKYNFNFKTTLFPAIMQGRESESSILNVVDKIYAEIENFDVIAIIRGGGSASDLACFDNYNLAFALAQIPKPIISGIGHDKDISIVDMIANQMQKTPTAAAEFLVDCVAQQYYFLEELSRNLVNNAKIKLQNARLELNNLTIRMKNEAGKKIEKQKNMLELFFSHKFFPITLSKLSKEKMKLDLFQKQIEISNPKNILCKGYAIITKNGKRIKSASEAKSGNCVEITFKNGRKSATIK